ncbi:MAG: hypothetical protein HQK51_09330, partial [Oligoflexia bacterium]|nr:hypothetical protein [Oligoflexia bacterium]
TKDGNTAAILAAHKGHLDILKFISTLPKFDINLQNKNGNTAAMVALFKADVSKAVKNAALLMSHPSFNGLLVDKQNKNIFEWAKEKGLDKQIEVELKKLLRKKVGLLPRLKELAETNGIDFNEVEPSLKSIDEHTAYLDDDKKASCKLCLEDISSEERILRSPSGKCDCTFCTKKTCVKGLQKHIISEQAIPKCPGGCRNDVTSSFLCALRMDADKISQFQARLLRQKLAQKKGFHFCKHASCPVGGTVLTAEEEERGKWYSCAVCDKDSFLGTPSTLDKYETKLADKLVELGMQAPPAGGHPHIENADAFNPEHAKYFLGRFRPCPGCGKLIEKVDTGESHHGDCRAMKCPICTERIRQEQKNPKAEFTWDFSYGLERAPEGVGLFDRKERFYKLPKGIKPRL